jgi:DNA adenine methylase/adenine-specific DNA-methyltransferase
MARESLGIGQDGGVTAAPLAAHPRADAALVRATTFPRLRYMGSKYRLLPALAAAFADVGGRTALDAFSGSGVVSYLLKAQGFAVTSNDFLSFPTAIARATVVNQGDRLDEQDLSRICGPAADERDFIQRTFDGLYFTSQDRAFLVSAWSHIDRMSGPSGTWRSQH